MKIFQTGFTLIELLVTLTIVVVLTVLAMPGFQSLLVARRLEAATDTLASDFRYARSEAIKRTNRVTICTSTNGNSCSGSSGIWKDGWIVFVDEDGDGTVDTGEAVLRVQDSLSGITSIASTSPVNDRRWFVFQTTGWSQAASQTFLVTPSGNTGVAARLVCISNKGRAAIRAKGVTSCT